MPLTTISLQWTLEINDITMRCSLLNPLRPRQNGRHFADDTFKCIFMSENVRISIKISLKFVPKGPINNNPALVQIMAWRWSGHQPLCEPMMASLLTHICVTRPQWVEMKVIWFFVVYHPLLIILNRLEFHFACWWYNAPFTNKDC